MKLLIAALATGMLLTVAPAWADGERREGWRGHATQQVRHWDDRWDRHRYSHRHHPRAHRHWQRYDDRRHYYAPPRPRHYHRDYSYGYYAPEPAPSIWFSWTVQ